MLTRTGKACIFQRSDAPTMTLPHTQRCRSPWRSFRTDDYLVKVSAIGLPNVDIKPPWVVPIWWIVYAFYFSFLCGFDVVFCMAKYPCSIVWDELSPQCFKKPDAISFRPAPFAAFHTGARILPIGMFLAHQVKTPSGIDLASQVSDSTKSLLH